MTKDRPSFKDDLFVCKSLFLCYKLHPFIFSCQCSLDQEAPLFWESTFIWFWSWMRDFDWLIDDHLYSAILRSLEQTHCARLWFYMSDKLFIARFLNIHRSGVLTALAWLVPHETAAISAQVLCTPYNHAQCHFMQSHIRKVYACLAVTCHLHFWRNDPDLLRATVVTRGWNGYRN